tara:strand:- start:275 stop:553 length:279 start_codon:yes stop_codon:yes gene_type:complete
MNAGEQDYEKWQRDEDSRSGERAKHQLINPEGYYPFDRDARPDIISTGQGLSTKAAYEKLAENATVLVDLKKAKKESEPTKAKDKDKKKMHT